jgi:hypothetical protein
MASKSATQDFESQWNTAAAWAQTNNIPSSDYLPVYQMDVQRLQTGEQPMSAAERNRAILAANNPNNVTPLPSDNPSPSSVFSNARNDLGMIATGLEPQHLVANLFDTFANTAKDLADPSRLIGPTRDATGANILQDTLLSFVPGAYDLGALLRGGPDALAEHPLISLLNLLPAGSSKLLTGALADSALGARLAKFGGTTTDALGQQSVQKMLVGSLMNHVTGKAPLGLGKTGMIQGLTIGERLQQWAGNSKLGTSKPIQDLAGDFFLNTDLYSGIKQNLLAPALQAVAALSPPERELYDQLSYALRMGKADTESVLNDRAYPITVTDALRKMLDGPIRFETEEAILAPTSVRGDKPDVMPIRRPDGSMGLYAGHGNEAVNNAKDGLKTARVDFVASFDAADQLRSNVEQMDAQLPTLGQNLQTSVHAAAEAAGQDEGLMSNIVTPDKEVFGRKVDEARKMFGDGGLISGLQEAVKAQDTDAIGVRADVISSRLNKWGYHSVDARENPAFVAAKKDVDALSEYAKRRHKLTDEIDRRINQEPNRVTAEVTRQRALLKTEQKRRRDEVRENHRAQHGEQNEGRRSAISKAQSDLQIRIGELLRNQQMENAEDVAIGDNAAKRATKQKADEIHAQVRQKINARDRSVKTAVEKERKRYAEIEKGINKTWDEARGSLNTRQGNDWEELSAFQKNEARGVGGELKQKMRTYVKALDDFHRAVWNHPTDDFRDMRYELYKDRLLASEHNAELVDTTMGRLQRLGLDKSRRDAIQSDRARLGEAVAFTVKDVYENPDNFNPDIVSAVKQASDEANQQADLELNTLIAQGHFPVWMPAAGAHDGVSSAISLTVGHGAPHVDVGHQRANMLVNTRYDIVAGASKAMTQTLTRDAMIDMIEHSIVPRTITGDDLRDQLDQLGVLEGFDPNAETASHAYSTELKKLGLARVDVGPDHVNFGFTFPRWEGKSVYMPTELATALRKLMAERDRVGMGIFDKGTRLFRFSILGLSPRYTAHILFGGTFLLALRSTPWAPTMIFKAARALRDGSLPPEIGRTPTQEGFSAMAKGLDEISRSSGRQMGNLAIQEHLSLVQHVTEGKASPFHWLKAAAELNIKFTRHVTKMQQAIAYLDYAASAERRGYFIDAVTGEKVTMTRERATVEAIDHVQSVFGNLRNMSPLERHLAKNIMPFYGWTRHILSYVARFPDDHPWRAMVLALMAFENSASVPKGLPERLQFLFFLGKPDAQGNVSAIDTRFMDPLRDIANYATLGGWLETLNPALVAPLAMINPQMVYGSNELYPNLTYNQFYGIETAGNQGNLETAAQQFIPQLGAVGPLAQAIAHAGDLRKLSSNPNAFYKSVFESLNVPFAQVQHINVKQIAAHDELARYQVAKQAGANAFQSGNFSSLDGYASVPNPLNPDYDISPQQLEDVYNQALVAYPGQVPIEVLSAPISPPGY